MNHINDLTTWLWYATMAAQPVLVAICVQRDVHKHTPWFPRYLALDFAASCLLLSIHNYQEYVACFYLLAILTAWFKFGILTSIISQVFGPYETLPRGTMARLLTGMALTMGASSGLIFRSQARNLDPAMNFLRTADSMLAASILCGFWIAVIYARKLGLYWRSQTAGIAAGFLFYSSVQTATKLVLSHAHWGAAIWVRNIGQVAYLATLFIWLGFILIPEPELTLTREDAEAALAVVRHTEERLRRVSSMFHQHNPLGTATIERRGRA